MRESDSRPKRSARTAASGGPARPAAASPWGVSPEEIAALTVVELKRLMRELFIAEAYRSGADASAVSVNTEERASGDGCDGWTPAPPALNPWLGSTGTCWQFRSGKAGAPAKLAREAAKRRPAATLANGGRFAVIASGSTSGEKGRLSRLKKLKDGARGARIAEGQLEVLTGESLAAWVNEHPAIAARVRGLPPGWKTLDDWLHDPLHKVAWQPADEDRRRLEAARRDLDPLSGSVRHLHLFGPPGVGKTRFALEACRDASWRDHVLYVPDAEEARVVELLEHAARTPAVRLVLVVDEVTSDRLAAFNTPVRAADGRVRLITIGGEGSIDRSRIVELEIHPLGAESMARVIASWQKRMPREQVDCLVKFADGFVRLAWLAANALASDPALDTSGLLREGDLRKLLETMIGEADDRRALHVAAVLARVGWTGPREVEGRTIAEHFGLDWPDVQARVQRFHDRFGIAPLAGDHRRLSPEPLANYLAVEAWESHPEAMRSLAALLPGGEARSAFCKRLGALAMSPFVSAFARAELERSFLPGSLTDAIEVERWAALGAADPVRAAQIAHRALAGASRAERLRIAGGARRRLVNALVDLAWRADCFHDAVLALAELAEAENESWANNATGEFLERFQLALGGTACPYAERLSVIDDLLARPEPACHRLGIDALARAAGQHAFRQVRPPPPAAAREPESLPAPGEDLVRCRLQAIERLKRAAAAPTVDAQDPLAEAARRMAVLVLDREVRDAVADFFQALLARFPALREALRLEVHRLLKVEGERRRTLPAEDVRWITKLHADLEDRSLSGQLRQALGELDWGSDATSLGPLAEALLAQPGGLEAEWPWLTSGEAKRAWDLGEALARADRTGGLAERMAGLPGRGPDLRPLCAYLHQRKGSEPPGWADDWLDAFESSHPGDAAVLVDGTWFCAPTDRGARRLARLARDGKLAPAAAERLVFGGWGLGPGIDALSELLGVLAGDRARRAAALLLLEQRVSSLPEDWGKLEGTALGLVVNGELFRTEGMTSRAWEQVARRLVPRHARAVARAICEAHIRRGEEPWLLEQSGAAALLHACAEADPAGVWDELVQFLEDPKRRALFAIGFPGGVVDRLPHQAVLAWVDRAPEERAAMVVRLAAKRLDDDSLAAKLLDRHGRLPAVGDELFSAYRSESWSGPASAHWEELARSLDQVSGKTSLGGVHDWARAAARELRRKAERERKHEEEERRRGG